MIYGDGEQSRDFTYVEDVVALLIKASNAAGVSGKVFNAGNGNRYTLNETWELLQKIEGISLPAQYGPSRPGDVRDSQADVTAAVRELGHKPRFTFEQGLRLTLDWYRTQRTIKRSQRRCRRQLMWWFNKLLEFVVKNDVYQCPSLTKIRLAEAWLRDPSR